ncbi:C40 family peptidase [Sphingosinicella sp. YJ22]|uniref:C40 family peptidase n=1 Tax=Sphingosinicella sp. YJ22 TaxID=1104780 RepID=UPI00140A8B7E|nr:C40 family peptidase [Sphingosinicella sp. YJ22]
MSGRADAIIARARAHVGIRFRAQGRGREGLDCVGLVAVALGIKQVRGDYALRGGAAEILAMELRAAGLCAAAVPTAGDVLVMQAGPGQLHLGIWTGKSLIHADARLRRVVERPGTPPWTVVGTWRFAEAAMPGDAEPSPDCSPLIGA